MKHLLHLSFLLAPLLFAITDVHATNVQEDPSKGAIVKIDNDAVGHVLRIHLGPIKLLPNTHHLIPGDLFFKFPFDGWITGYQPRLVDGSGRTLAGDLLHHVDIYNASRRDILCPLTEEYMFSAGSELTPWPTVSGTGYPVAQDDVIRIKTMFQNLTSNAYPDVYVDVLINYMFKNVDSASMREMFIAYFSVTGCGATDYDLKTGESNTTADYSMTHNGVLLGVGGHMHDYGRQLRLDNLTRGQSIATLDPKLDPTGHVTTLPIIYFKQGGGYQLRKGEVVRVSATYNNPTGAVLAKGAMGIIVGYFIVDSD